MLLTSLLNALPGAVTQGLIWGLMAIGVYITYRILDVADLTVDGSLALGGAACVMLIRGGVNPWLALLIAALCGAAAGGLTGLHAAEGDCALELTALLRELPGQAGKSVLCAVLWLVLPPAAALFRPAALWLSGIAAARGFVLALSLAVAVAQGEGAAVLAAEALPAVISVSALLAACTLVWECTQNAAPWAKSRAPFALCLASAALSALLRVFFAILLAG